MLAKCSGRASFIGRLQPATLRVLDDLLVVLMLVEILHTVRISIHSHLPLAEPFLIVGLIASIRRILVITLEAGQPHQGWNVIDRRREHISSHYA